MDRNTIWGSAGGMVFENDKSWDAQDRFNWVHKTTDEVFKSAGNSLVGGGDQIGVFNPLNWKRNDPVALRLPAGKSLEGTECEAPGSVRMDPRSHQAIQMSTISVGGEWTKK